MTLANGRQFLSIPGPTNVPDKVLAAMHRPAIDIYGGELIAVTNRCLDRLKTVFATTGNAYIYAANGHGGWEAALSNVLSRGDTVLVLESGRFAIGWGDMARIMGVTIETLPGSMQQAVDPEALEKRLRADTQGTIKAILVVQIDTASGVVNDIPALRRAIDAASHDALFMVDGIASIATMDFQMDEWGVDVAVTGSQKGLMMTPGLAFNAAGPKAKAAHKHADLVTHYWDWTFREGDEHYMKYCGTPPEHMLFGLDCALDLLLDEGLPQVFRRHRILSDAVKAAVEVWSQEKAIGFNITNPAERSPAVTTVSMMNGTDPEVLRTFTRTRCGVELGTGIGELAGKAFRIAHMGHVNAPMVLGTLGAIEMGLKVLNIPHGRGGVEAAIEVMAEGVAGR
jgi:alanine-glyoxylate transaminase/serine-glyoxylate transaminase/serine-pyruvate transaminase